MGHDTMQKTFTQAFYEIGLSVRKTICIKFVSNLHIGSLKKWYRIVWIFFGSELSESNLPEKTGIAIRTTIFCQILLDSLVG